MGSADADSIDPTGPLSEELMRRERTTAVSQERLRMAREEMPDAVFRKAQQIQAESVLLSWEECRLIAELVTPTEWPSRPHD